MSDVAKVTCEICKGEGGWMSPEDNTAVDVCWRCDGEGMMNFVCLCTLDEMMGDHRDTCRFSPRYGRAE